MSESVAYTCETAGHFWLLHVLARWEKFVALSGTAASKAEPGSIKGALLVLVVVGGGGQV